MSQERLLNRRIDLIAQDINVDSFEPIDPTLFAPKEIRADNLSPNWDEQLDTVLGNLRIRRNSRESKSEDQRTIYYRWRGMESTRTVLEVKQGSTADDGFSLQFTRYNQDSPATLNLSGFSEILVDNLMGRATFIKSVEKYGERIKILEVEVYHTGETQIQF